MIPQLEILEITIMKNIEPLKGFAKDYIWI